MKEKKVIYLAISLLIAIALELLVYYIYLGIIPINFSASLDSGWAALFGALIGSGISTIFGIWLHKSQARQARAALLFEAKRLCYAGASSYLTKALYEVGEGKTFPSTKEDEVEHYKVMNELSLIGGEEVRNYREEYINKITQVMKVPKDQPQLLKEKSSELTDILRNLRKSMRDELTTSP